MRIYRMEATFGKLEGAVLTLEPGLNVLNHPNEWGKSTWCAFLLAMLYGIDTRAKSTKTVLADKERYAPWSGKPMAGRIDLHWQGKDITIERRTKGRIPLGEFRAYETDSGFPLYHLTAANCGQVLLGMEQSVYCRSGFIRLEQMPVTQDEHLLRRLQSLVTTGEEDQALTLEQSLRDLKNQCRYNRTGRIPQAERERDTLREQLREGEELAEQRHKLMQRREAQKDLLDRLRNHLYTLDLADAEAHWERMAQARETLAAAEEALARREEACAALPEPREAEQKLQALRQLRRDQEQLRREPDYSLPLPQKPESIAAFRGLSPQRAEEMVERDMAAYRAARGAGAAWALWALCLVLLGAAAWLAWQSQWIYAGLALLPGVVAAVLGAALARSRGQRRRTLEEKYGAQPPEEWERLLRDHTRKMRDWEMAIQAYRSRRQDLEPRLEALERNLRSLCGGSTPEQMEAFWQRVLDQWKQYQEARREYARAEGYLRSLEVLDVDAPLPYREDDLTLTRAETEERMEAVTQELSRLENRLGQCEGKIESRVVPEIIRGKLRQTELRLEALEKHYAALNLALQTLEQARGELQRRFAPRIVSRAKELLGRLTGGRYTQLGLGEDLRLTAGAVGEESLRDVLWRSAGTVDQVYLALRLAVAEALSPDTPLVLDDALARFDRDRRQAAMEVLEDLAKERQVIVFACTE